MKKSFFSRTNADGGNKDDDDSRSKPQPKAKAGAKKTGYLKRGPAAKKKTPPRGSKCFSFSLSVQCTPLLQCQLRLLVSIHFHAFPFISIF